MADKLDPYSECPCGSGDKVKFCCKDAANDLVRAQELIQHGQFAQVRQALESLQKRKISERGQLVCRFMLIHNALCAGNEEAGDALYEFVRENPTYALARIMVVMLKCQTEPFSVVRDELEEIVELELGRGDPRLHSVVRNVVELADDEELKFAATYWARIGMRNPPDQQTLDFYREVLTDSEFPLQSGVFVPHGPSGSIDEFEQSPEGIAYRQFARGQAHRAASGYAQLCEQHPTARNFYSLAVSLACAGELLKASEAFRKSASLETDFEQAVDAEILALECTRPTAPATIVGINIAEIDNASQVISKLESMPQLIREDENGTAFLWLDRPLSGDVNIALGDLSQVLGRVSVYVPPVSGGSTEPERARVLISQVDVTDTESLAKFQEEIFPGMSLAWERSEGRRMTLEDERPFDKSFPGGEHDYKSTHRLIQEWTQSVLHDVLPKQRFNWLDGKTIAEAVAVPELKARAAAVLAEVTERLNLNTSVDESDVRARFGLPPVEPLVDFNNGYTMVRARRVSWRDLSDEFLAALSAMVESYGRIRESYEARLEKLSRIKEDTGNEVANHYFKLSEFSLALRRPDEAIAWLLKGRKAVRLEGEQAVITELDMSLREILLRQRVNPQAPEILKVAHHVWDLVSRKVPNARESVGEALRRWKIPGPWNASSLTLPGDGDLAAIGSGTVSESGLWTPGAPEPQSGGPSKLWLPGQE